MSSDPVPTSAIYDATAGGRSVIVITGGSTGDVLTLQADGTYAAETPAGASPGGSSGQMQFNNAGAFGGTTAVVYAGSGTHVVITAQSSTAIPLCVKGAASQTGNLTEWRSSDGSLMLRVKSDSTIIRQVDSLGVRLEGASTGAASAAAFGQNGFYYSQAGQYGFLTATGGQYKWGSHPWSPSPDAVDTGIARQAAGIVVLTNGSSGAGVLHLRNTSEPATPTGGGILYVESGALKYKGSGGTVTTLGTA